MRDAKYLCPQRGGEEEEEAEGGGQTATYPVGKKTIKERCTLNIKKKHLASLFAHSFVAYLLRCKFAQKTVKSSSQTSIIPAAPEDDPVLFGEAAAAYLVK